MAALGESVASVRSEEVTAGNCMASSVAGNLIGDVRAGDGLLDIGSGVSEVFGSEY